MELEQNKEIYISELEKKIQRYEKIINALIKRVEKHSLLSDSDFSYFENNAILNQTVEETQKKINEITKQLDSKLIQLEKLERELRQKEERLNEIIYSIDDVVWSISYPQIRLLFVNKAIEKVFGIPIENAYNLPNLWFHLINPDDRTEFFEAIARLEETPQIEITYRIQTLDGQTRYILDKLTRKVNKQGKIYQIDGIARDITDLKLAQIDIENTKQQYELIFESVAEGIIILDLQKNLVAINTSACKLFGYKKSEVLGRASEIFLSQEFLDNIFKDNETNILYSTFIFQSEERRRNGEKFIVEVSSKKFHLNNETFIICSFTDITKRKEAENELLKQKNILSESEHKLQAILSNTSQSFVLIDNNYTILTYNKVFEQDIKKFFGQELPESGKIYEIIPSHFKDIFFEHSLKALGGVSTQLEIDLPDKEGKFESFVFYFEPVKYHADQIDAILISSRNITKLKEKETELRKQNAFINSLLEAIPSPVFYKDKGGRYLGCNRAFEEFIGLSREDMIGRTVFEIFDYEKAQKYYEMDKELFDNPGRQTYEYEIKTKNGEIRYVIFNKATFNNPFTNEVEGLIGTIIDITDRKLIERRLIKNQAELEGIYNSTSVLICLLDGQMNIKNANSAFIQYTGWPDKSRKNKIGDLLDCICSVKSPFGCSNSLNCNSCILRQIIQDTYKTGTPYYNIEHKTFILENEKPQEKYFLASTSRIQSENEFNVILSLIDITERKELEKKQDKLLTELKIINDLLQATIEQKNSLIEQLSKAQDDLLRLNAEKDKFFSIIAHDLKNPFIVLKNRTEKLKNEIDFLNADDIKGIVNELTEISDNTYKLLQNLLDWSRVKLGKIDLQKNEFDFYEVVFNTIYLLSNFAESKNITIINKIEPNTIIKADNYMISTVIRNLISNAIKFTNNGGEITIDANFYELENTKFMKVTVEDNGIGIEPSRLTELFKIDSKTSTQGTNNETGTGIGLILCKEFIEKHGGIIWAESTLGEGSRFHFTIPIS